MGQRVAKVAAANQRFAYDEGNHLLGEYGATNRSYIWLDAVPVAETTFGWMKCQSPWLIPREPLTL